MTGKEPPERASSDSTDDRVSRDLLELLREDEAPPPRTLVNGVLSRVRRLLALRDLFDGVAVGPFRAFATALRNHRGGSDPAPAASDEARPEDESNPRATP